MAIIFRELFDAPPTSKTFDGNKYSFMAYWINNPTLPLIVTKWVTTTSCTFFVVE